MRYGVHLCFDGSNFAGWQRQINAISIQQELEDKLSILIKNNVEIVGCGRTDAGVHASNFFAHFDSENTLNTEKITYQWNSLISKDIHIFDIFAVDESWNARFDATKRIYRYYILKQRNPFLSSYSYYIPYDINANEMRNAVSKLVGNHDFTSFAKLHGGQNNGFCNVFFINIIEQNELIVFEICANRFIRNMVRAIVGTMLDIGRGHISCNNITEIMNSCNRNNAGASVPAQGLFLHEVHYENHSSIPINTSNLIFI